jgi:C-terminal processing protease CtpA/Prc
VNTRAQNCGCKTLHLREGNTQNAHAGGNGPVTTLGIMFDEMTRVVENVLVGGPAFNSQKVFKGDTILSIDGQDASQGDLGTMLRGKDKPDSIVTIGLKRVSGNVEDVKLQRMVSSQLAEKREMFELFTVMTNRAKIGKDKVLETTVQKVFDLWTAEMLEEYEHDAITANDIHEMQECCKRWLDELLQILEADEKVVGIQKKTTKSVRAAPPPAGGQASVSEEDLEKLRAELVNL